MARTVCDTDLQSREVRTRLVPRHEPYWCVLDRGCHLGYYKGRELRVWIARFVGGKWQYLDERIGLADDSVAADGVTVMNYDQAEAAARNWSAEQAIKEAGLPVDDSPFVTVGQACNRD